MYQMVMKIIEKLSKDELGLLLAVIIVDWCDMRPPGTVEEFINWLAGQQLNAEDELEVAQLLAKAEERGLAAGMLPPVDPAAWG